jgi:hypothetical protein
MIPHVKTNRDVIEPIVHDRVGLLFRHFVVSKIGEYISLDAPYIKNNLIDQIRKNQNMIPKSVHIDIDELIKELPEN